MPLGTVSSRLTLCQTSTISPRSSNRNDERIIPMTFSPPIGLGASDPRPGRVGVYRPIPRLHGKP